MTDVPKNGTAARQLWVSIAALVITVLGSGVVAILWIGAIAADVRGNHEATVNNSSDITELKRKGADMSLSLAEDCRQLATVEVQMGTVETVINKTQASNERELALMWQRAYSQEYPTIFYPITIPHESMPCMR